MSNIVLFLLSYFGVSFFIVYRIYSQREEWNFELKWLTFLYIFCLGPLLVCLILILNVFFPPPSDPWQLIYKKFHPTTGKTKQWILDEIERSGQTIGGGLFFEAMFLDEHLDNMLACGFLRSERVTLGETEVCHISFSELDLSIGVIETDGLAVDRSPEGTQQFTLYFQGKSPPKRPKWRWRFLSSLEPICGLGDR